MLLPLQRIYLFLGLLPAMILSELRLAPQWFPVYVLQFLVLIAYQASVPFGK